MDPSSGIIKFRGEDIKKVPPHQIIDMGMAHVPEGRRVFSKMTVYENLEMGAFIRKDKREILEDFEMVYKRFPRLKERLKQPAGTLSGGEQQMLAISRALMARPRVLLLDEPSLGLSPRLVKEIFAIIRRINEERGVTILLVEQNANMALQLSDYGYVLEVGRIVMEGDSQRLMENEDIREFYLGQKEQGARGKRRCQKRKVWR